MTISIRTISLRVGGLAATAAITLGGALVAPALADDVQGPAEPCASQQAKVDKATDALARVTGVFERQQEKVKKARKAVAEAEAGRARAEARKALSKAKEARDETKATHRAQQQRLLKAQERLEACEAEQPTPAPRTTAAA